MHVVQHAFVAAVLERVELMQAEIARANKRRKKRGPEIKRGGLLEQEVEAWVLELMIQEEAGSCQAARMLQREGMTQRCHAFGVTPAVLGVLVRRKILAYDAKEDRYCLGPAGENDVARRLSGGD